MVENYDIVYTQVYISTVMATIATVPTNMSAVVTKLQLSQDSNLGLGTITVKIYSGSVPVQVITLTPNSPTYVEQEYTYGVLRFDGGSVVTANTETGTVSLTIGFYYTYGRV